MILIISFISSNFLFWQISNQSLILDLSKLIILSIAIFIPFILKNFNKKKENSILSPISNIFFGIGFSYWMRIIYVLPTILMTLSIIIAIPLFIIVYNTRKNDYWKECKNCPELTNRIIFNQCSGIDNSNITSNIIFDIK